MNARLPVGAIVSSLCLSAVAMIPAISGASQQPDLAGLSVAIDVGHNRTAGGATSARGRMEFSFNLDTARIIAEVLRTAGANAFLINEKGDMTGLVERPSMAARLGADVFISIHHDSVNDRYLQTWDIDGKTYSYCDRFSGYSVFCSKKSIKAAQSRALALEVGAAMLAAQFQPTLHHNEPIPGENHSFIDKRTGVYEYTDLAVVKYSKLPSILLECGVIVNREEEGMVQTRNYQQRIGEAIATALASARKKCLVGPPSTSSRGLGKLFKLW